MLPSAVTGMVVMWSQLTTDSVTIPFAEFRGTSVDSPRISVVIGATVTVPRGGRTVSRGSTRTRRPESRSASWIDRISSDRSIGGSLRGARENPDHGRMHHWTESRRHVQQPVGDAPAQVHA